MMKWQGIGFAALLTAAVAQTPALAQQKTVTWVTHPAILKATGDGELLRKFEQQTGIKVEVTTFPTDALGPKINTEFVAGSDAYDIVSTADAFWTSSLARFVEPLEALMQKKPLPAGGLADFSPGFVQQFRVPQTPDGKVYGIPNRMSVDILYYRKDLLEAAGLPVPGTLDAYVETARKLTKDTNGDGRPDIFGMVYQGIQSQQGALDWYDWAAPLGVDILTPPDWKAPAFNTPAAVKSLEMRRKVIAEGIASPGSLSYSFDDAINAMAQGNAAMTIMSPAYFVRLEDPKASTVSGKIGYAPAPRDPSVKNAYFARGWALMINKASKRKDEAWELISFLTSPENQIWMAVNQGNPISRISVAKDAAFAEKVPVAGALVDALANAKIQPNAPALPRAYDVLAKHLSAAQGGQVPAAKALADADQEVRALIK